MNRYWLTTEGWSILNFVTCNNLLDHYGPSDHCSSHWGLGQLQSFALVILKSDRLFSYPWAMLWLDHCLVGALMWDLWLVYSNAVLLNVVMYESLLATLRHNLDLNLPPHWILLSFWDMRSVIQVNDSSDTSATSFLCTYLGVGL